MATNFEHYKEEILKILNNKPQSGLALRSGKLGSCDEGFCHTCRFLQSGCGKGRFEWLYAEHMGQLKLTKKERLFCELAETGWIARDSDGKVFYYPQKPHKEVEQWGSFTCKNICFLDAYSCFPFIKFEDKKPWAVEDLLKLEVEE